MKQSKFSRACAALLFAVAAVIAGPVFAHGGGIGGGLVIGVGASGFAGSVTGSAASVSEGNAVAASVVNGYGSSFQHTDGYSTGSATIGGVVNHQGAQVVTQTTQAAQVYSVGNVTGNAPIMSGDLIANGTAGLAKTTNYSSGNANFATGGIVGIGGVGGLFGF